MTWVPFKAFKGFPLRYFFAVFLFFLGKIMQQRNLLLTVNLPSSYNGFFSSFLRRVIKQNDALEITSGSGLSYENHKLIFGNSGKRKNKKPKYHFTWTHCLKITENVAFSKTRQNGTFLAFLINLCPLKNVNVARFARNVEWDFFCDFQTLWKRSEFL